jgi:hypothetical protein
MVFTYEDGEIISPEDGESLLTYTIDRNGPGDRANDPGYHGEIILVHSDTPELRDLIVGLLNEHEEEKARNQQIMMEYTQLTEDAFKLREEHPWLVSGKPL